MVNNIERTSNSELIRRQLAQCSDKYEFSPDNPISFADELVMQMTIDEESRRYFTEKLRGKSLYDIGCAISPIIDLKEGDILTWHYGMVKFKPLEKG